jgi:hypothetical protein
VLQGQRESPQELQWTCRRACCKSACTISSIGAGLTDSSRRNSRALQSRATGESIRGQRLRGVSLISTCTERIPVRRAPRRKKAFTFRTAPDTACRSALSDTRLPPSHFVIVTTHSAVNVPYQGRLAEQEPEKVQEHLHGVSTHGEYPTGGENDVIVEFYELARWEGGHSSAFGQTAAVSAECPLGGMVSLTSPVAWASSRSSGTWMKCPLRTRHTRGATKEGCGGRAQP